MRKEKEEEEQMEVGRVLQKGFLGEDKCRSPKGKQKEEKERKTTCSQGKGRGKKSSRDDTSQNHSKNCCFPVHDI